MTSVADLITACQLAIKDMAQAERAAMAICDQLLERASADGYRATKALCAVRKAVSHSAHLQLRLDELLHGLGEMQAGGCV